VEGIPHWLHSINLHVLINIPHQVRSACTPDPNSAGH
jgi:hypothetical protein